ncbi:MAG: tripartite tricarboxylate transporter TctB family protein [Synergistales bacterium]|nr:tripartite tricarboxylate transporter TctB family protein [Synergistales bacterium]
MFEKITGGIMIGISLILFFTLNEVPFKPVFFPKTLLILLMLLSIVLIFRGTSGKQIVIDNWKDVVGAGGIMICYVILIARVPFIIVTTGLFFIALLLSRYSRSMVRIWGISFGLALAFYFVFARLFNVPI